MLRDIPVTFEYEGKEYKCVINKVSGAASSGLFHLSVNGYHWGQLFYVEGHPGFDGGIHAVEPGWRFTSNTKDMGHLAEFLGNVVVSSLDSTS